MVWFLVPIVVAAVAGLIVENERQEARDREREQEREREQAREWAREQERERRREQAEARVRERQERLERTEADILATLHDQLTGLFTSHRETIAGSVPATHAICLRQAGSATQNMQPRHAQAVVQSLGHIVRNARLGVVFQSNNAELDKLTQEIKQLQALAHQIEQGTMS